MNLSSQRAKDCRALLVDAENLVTQCTKRLNDQTANQKSARDNLTSAQAAYKVALAAYAAAIK